MNTSDMLDSIRTETRGQDCFFESLDSARRTIGDFWSDTLSENNTDLDFLSAQYAQATAHPSATNINTNRLNSYPLWY